MPPKKTTSGAADGGTGTTSEKAVGGRRHGAKPEQSEEEETPREDHVAVEKGRAPEARARAAPADVAERDTESTGEELDTESTSARRGGARPASDEEEEDSRSCKGLAECANGLAKRRSIEYAGAHAGDP